MRAMLLAAGMGSRLLPLTQLLPKPLLEVGGQSLIERHLERLAAAGFTEIVVNTHHLGDQIIQRLGNGSNWGVAIEYSQEATLLETGGGIRRALPLLGSQFVVVSADTYTNLDFQLLLEPLPAGAKGRLVMVPNPVHHPTGDFGISETGRLTAEGQKYTWCSVGVFTSGLFAAEPQEAFKLRRVFDKSVAAGELVGLVYEGLWRNVDTVERYEALKAEMLRSKL